jgi:hypothetical protein
MSIVIPPELENRLRSRAESQGLTVEAYVERLLRADQGAESELERLALEGTDSGRALAIEPGYWEEKHRRLDARLAETKNR